MKTQWQELRIRLLNCYQSGTQAECWKIAEEYIRSDSSCRIEELLAAIPDALDLESLPVEVVVAEIDSRRAKGEIVFREEYVRRFPIVADSLPATLFETDGSRLDSTNVNPFSSAASETHAHAERVASPASTSVFDLRPGQEFGSYRVLCKIGQGGMGAVYKALHVKLNKEVALKILPVNLTWDPRRVKRFEREMQSLGALEHPNIVRATDAGEVEGIHYLAMEYVEGVDLQRQVKENGPCSLTHACQYIRDATLGLYAAHEVGLVHRDIKPANLLLAKSGMVKVSDFGLARLQQAIAPESDDVLLTRDGECVGTPDYMAPEQWERSDLVDHRSDIYALGCSLFFLLTGRPPYSGDGFVSLSQKMKGHLLGQPPSLAQVSGKPFPAAVESLIRDLLHKSAAERVDSAATLIERLDAIGEPQQLLTGRRQFSTLHKWSVPLVIGIILLSCGSLLVWMRSNLSSSTQATRSPSVGQMRQEPNIPIALPEIRIDLFEKPADKILLIGTLGAGVDSASFGDWLQMEITLPQEVYCSLIALNPTKDSQSAVQFFPEQFATLEMPVRKLRFPSSTNDAFRLNDGVGQQCFILIWSLEPLPVSLTDGSLADHITWSPNPVDGIWRQDDEVMERVIVGRQQLAKPRTDRGAIETLWAAEPTQLKQLLSKLQDSIPYSSVHVTAIAFPVRESAALATTP